MSESQWPYDLPIWRRFHRAVSPDGTLVARIDPAYEESMGNPTSGMLCVSIGLHVPRCNPSFLWSDDSRYLAVPQFFDRFGVFRRQRLLVIGLHERRVWASRTSNFHFQPESFAAGRLVVAVNPTRSEPAIAFQVPADLSTAFRPDAGIPWPEMPVD